MKWEANWQILKTIFQSPETSSQTVRNLQNKIDRSKVPSAQIVNQIVKVVRQTEYFLYKKTRVRAGPVCLIEYYAIFFLIHSKSYSYL